MTEVVYPIFLEIACQVEDDEYWRLLYEDMAFGRFPSGVYIQKKYFCCIYKERELSIPLEGDPFVLFTQIHSMLKNNVGILSEKDRKSHASMVMANQKLKDEKRVIKDSILISFVARQGDKYLLPDYIIRRIYSLLIIGFMFKTILLRSVRFQDADIEHVRGFRFDTKCVRVSKNVFQLKRSHVADVLNVNIKKNSRDTIPSISSSWSKYMNHITSISNITNRLN